MDIQIWNETILQYIIDGIYSSRKWLHWSDEYNTIDYIIYIFILYKKNSFAAVSKNLARNRSKIIFLDYQK